MPLLVSVADAYMGAWQSILDVLAVATERRSEPPPEESADRLMRQFNAADHQLSVIEATLRVRVYGRAIRHDLTSLLVDVLYANPEIRQVDDRPLTLGDFPRPEWANCSDEKWLSVVNSIPFGAMLVSQVWSLPGRLDDEDDTAAGGGSGVTGLGLALALHMSRPPRNRGLSR